MDTGSLMARYGARIALGLNQPGSPTNPAASGAPSFGGVNRA